jgi:hypothetical protein
MRIRRPRLTMSIAVLTVLAAADAVQAFHIVRGPVVRQRTVVRGGAGVVRGGGEFFVAPSESFFVAPSESFFLRPTLTEAAFFGTREFSTVRSASESAHLRRLVRESMQEALAVEREAALTESSNVPGRVGGVVKPAPSTGDAALLTRMDSIVTKLDNINASLNNILKALEKNPPAKAEDPAVLNTRIAEEVSAQLQAALAKLPKPESGDKIAAAVQKVLQPQLEEQKRLIEEVKARQIDGQALAKALRDALGEEKAKAHKDLLEKLEKKN